jgi:hypothetical protein
MITRICLNEIERIEYTAKLFDVHFPLRLEPFIFDMAGSLSRDYLGGYWDMYKLDNGGFYMTPDSGTPFQVSCMNGYDGTLSSDAFGLTICLYAYSNLSFSGNPELADTCTKQYHLLQEYMFEHPEVRRILAAID